MSGLSERLARIEVGQGEARRAIAIRTIDGHDPTVVWFGGFKSDMAGTKAEALARWARSQGRAFLRFDYSGHGESGGAFTDGTISRWTEDAVAALSHVRGPALVVGSSMGAWIALLVAARRLASIGGLVLIAPAVDFTERLMWAAFPEDIRRQIETEGLWTRPSAYDPGGYPITKALIEDGRLNLLMDGLIEPGCPVHILQGQRDPDVPSAHALAVAERIARDDLTVTLIRDGDHRLSRDEDIALMIATVSALAERVGAP